MVFTSISINITPFLNDSLCNRKVLTIVYHGIENVTTNDSVLGQPKRWQIRITAVGKNKQQSAETDFYLFYVCPAQQIFTRNIEIFCYSNYLIVGNKSGSLFNSQNG